MLTHTEQSSRAEALALEAAELARGDAGDRGLGRTTVLSDEPGAPVRVIWVGGA